MEPKDQTPHINVDYFEDLTGDIYEPSQKGLEGEIGDRIKSLREQKGLSVADMARATGFNAELLSQIENHEVYPQLGTVIKLSKSLDAAFGRLLSGAGERPYAITRKKDRKTIHRSTSQKGKKQLYSYKGLAPEVAGRSMEPLIVQLEESTEKEISSHEGEEFIFVLFGTVVLEIAEKSFELEPGDSAYYLSSTPHWITSKQGSATILAVIYEG